MLSEFTLWSHFLGAASALGSAFLWAVAAILFAQIGEKLSARTINLVKGFVAFVCLAFLLLIYSTSEFEWRAFGFLALSGIIGIAIGDTLYFQTLQRLGAKLTLLIGTLIPVVTGVSALFLFNETISHVQVFGLLITLFGVAFVLWNKTTQNTSNYAWFSGVTIACIYVFAESAGILLTKYGLNHYNSVEATFIRQIFGVAALVFWGLAVKDLVGGFEPLRKNSRLLGLLIATSFIGAFLGTWLSIFALESTYAAVAVTLNATSPIFVLPLAYWFLKEKFDKKQLIGSLVAVFGIAVYFVNLS